MICRAGRLVSGNSPDRGNQISVLATKLMAFMFKSMEHCSKDYMIIDINSASVLWCQHQWELEQKKTDDIKAPKVDKNNWAKIMENIVLHLKLVRDMRGTPMAYVVQRHVKVAHISPRSGTYLNLDNYMMARAPIVDARLNLKVESGLFVQCLSRPPS